MANPRYNQQVTNRRGAMKGGRMKKMGGGTAKRKMFKAGSNGNGKGKVPNKLKGFSKLPEKVQVKIDKKLAKKV